MTYIITEIVTKNLITCRCIIYASVWTIILIVYIEYIINYFEQKGDLLVSYKHAIHNIYYIFYMYIYIYKGKIKKKKLYV